MKAFEIAVIGAGIAGCALAYELARRGRSVVVFDRAGVGAGASGRNTGTLLHQREPEVAEMMRVSLESYKELEHGPVGFDLVAHDQLLLAWHPENLRALDDRVKGIQELEIKVERAEIDTLRRDMPALSPELAAAYLVEDAWTVDAMGTTHAFAEAARQSGADLRTHCQVAQIAAHSGQVEGVLTDNGHVPADKVVIASGPWVQELLPEMPVVAGRGWLFRTTRLPFKLPWIIEEISWPDQDALGGLTIPASLSRLASGGHDAPVVEAFVLAPLPGHDALLGASLASSLRDAVEGIDMPERLSRRALTLAPGLADVRITRAWSGLRPMAPDGMPIAGQTTIEGLYLHGGHGSLGMQAAPATARWLAETICAGQAEREWLSPARFQRSDK